ncbi:MAG TPA: MMPL family transporter, partial [Planctomycetaceae bacterium]|nr:MMPL family transporter [Planctomycetaceae bacterium]
MSHRLLRVLDRRPFFVLVLLLSITLLTGGLATQLKFEFSPQALLAGNDDLIRDLEEMKRTFSIQDSVLLVVIEATGDRDVIAPEILNWQAETVKIFEIRDGVTEVRSIATMEIPGRTLSFSPELEIRPLIPDFPADEDDADRVRRTIERVPSLTGTMLSEDLKLGMMLVYLSTDFEAVEQMAPVVHELGNHLKESPPPAGYRVSLSGLPYIRVDAVAALEKDQARLLPLSGALYLVALVLVFRRVAGSLLPLFAVGMSLVWLMGIMVAVGSSFNLVSNILPILLMVIGMSNCVHLLDAYAEVLHETQGDRREAARQTTQYMSRCCLLTLLTTGIGFICLSAARSDVLREFAWQAAVGIACLYVCIIGTFGALLRFFRPSRRSVSGAPLGYLTATLGRWVTTHPRAIMLASGLVVLGAVLLGSTVRVNSSVIETYDDQHPTQVTMRAVERHLTGLLPIEVHLTSTDEERLLTNEVAQTIRQFEAQALTHPEVLYARSHIDVLQDLTGLTESEWEAETRDRTIDRGLSYARRIGGLSGLSDFLTADHREARVLLKVRDAGTLRLREVIADLHRDLRQRFP